MSVTGTGASAQDAQVAAAIGSQTGFTDPMKPNLADFLWFLSDSVQIPATALPVTSPWPQYALTQARGLVLCVASAIAIQYTLACYNCATHILFSITPDVQGNNFFLKARSNEGNSLVNPSTGLVASSSDESTSANLAVPEWASRLTISDLDFYKTPWGRAYLAYNQSYGPTIWGLT